MNRDAEHLAIAIGLTVATVLAVCGCPTPTPSPVTPQPDATDAVAPGVLHTYTCPVNDAGVAWTCQDGVTTPPGTCASYGCTLSP